SYHFQMSRGRIADIHLYQDTFHLWQVWSDLGAGVEPYYLKAGKIVGAIREHTVDPLPDITPEDRVVANKTSVRRFLTSVHNGKPEAVRAVWDPEGMWSFAVGGDYSPGLRAFEGAPRWDREGLIQMTQNAARNHREPVHLNVFSLIGEEDEISAEAVGILVRANGRAYRQHYSFHFKARNGSLLEGHVYQDTLHQYDVTLDPAHNAPVATRTSAD